jgi:hypothetical protein
MNLSELAAIQFLSDPAAHSFTWEENFSRITFCTAVSKASGTLLLIFHTAFSSWLRPTEQ